MVSTVTPSSILRGLGLQQWPRDTSSSSSKVHVLYEVTVHGKSSSVVQCSVKCGFQ